MNKSPAAIAAASLLLMGASGIAGAQEQQTFTYATYFVCDVGLQDRADEIVEQVDKPAFEAAIASGSIAGWGWLKHHTGGQWRRVQYYSASSIEGLLDAQKKITDQTEATAKGKALGKEFANACRSHDDYIWRRVAGNANTAARGLAGFSVYYVCDSSRESQADELVKRIFAPMYDKLVADGKLTSWGWMEHIVGGEYRRLATMTAKDMPSLMAARGAIVAAFQDDPLASTLDDICGSHADYMWDTKFAAP
ncbi:MAG: hypothetical protein NDI84_03925 [Steroidobacteraceae bacterium]|nr:hypothetical protein [Steroidobacteraceae bacterium]